MRARSGARLTVLVLAATFVLTSCGGFAPTSTNADEPAQTPRQRQPAFHGTVVDPPMDPPTQRLRNTAGRRFSVASQPADRVTVLFFGYTHCPDVCPTAMADLAAARAKLPSRLRERVNVVFVTEDPARDNPATLREWLDRFDPTFIGLRGGNEATETMLEQLGLPQTQRDPKPEEPIKHPDTRGPHDHHGDYAIGHAGVVYVFGPGDHTVVYTGGTTPTQYAQDFARLLTGGGGRAQH